MNNQFDEVVIYMVCVVLTFALALIVNRSRKPEHKDEIHILAIASVLWPITIFIGFVSLIVNYCFIWGMRR
ncbi:MAG: hypothetical protein ACFWUG_19015 [Rahnella inusitata]